MNDQTQMPEDQRVQTAQIGNYYFLFLMLFLMIMIFPEFRMALGYAAGLVFNPLFYFDGRHPIYTLLGTGLILTLINTWARHHFTDWIMMAKVQQRSRALNAVMRDALRKQDMDKIEKLRKVQLKYASETMQMQAGTMKATTLTMFIAISIFTWLWMFVSTEAHYTYVAIPWAQAVELNTMVGFFPSWILLYSAFTMPLAWVIQYIFKIFEFRKKLEEIDEESPDEAIQ